MAFWNNEEVAYNTLKISAHDRSFYFADAIYEVIRVYQGQAWLLDEHLARLKNSLQIVRIEVSIGNVKEQVLQNIIKNEITDGYTYVQISRGAAPRSHGFPHGITPNIYIYIAKILKLIHLDYLEHQESKQLPKLT
jgi:D-alanine transaminase